MLALIDAITDTATEPAPIPDNVAIATLERIAEKQRRDLDNACAIDPLVMVVALDGNAAGRVKA